MTGISDVMRSARKVYWHSKYQIRRLILSSFPSWLARLLLSCSRSEENECDASYDKIPVPQLEFFREKASALTAPSTPLSAEAASTTVVSFRWSLLLPVCYRADGSEASIHSAWNRLEELAQSIRQTSTDNDRQHLKILIGIDRFDWLFDCAESKEKLCSLFSAIGIQSRLIVLPPMYRQKLCWIWNHLARLAVTDEQSDFFVLIGDDIQFLTQQWKTQIENEFLYIHHRRRLPFGVGCVCFRDHAYTVFPTFPVIHRIHFSIFNGELFPNDFVNQHADPFLFELYRRFGASKFSATAALVNRIGGMHDTTRYKKHNVECWYDELLTRALSQLSMYLGQRMTECSKVYCMNIVVPSYRCDFDILKRIAALNIAEERGSVHILIVVDNPSSPHLAAVKELEDWSYNHLVRVYVQSSNLGASCARNTGMAQSFGDYTVLLDDDIIPGAKLLDAYLSAILRYPQAKILAGVSKLSSPSPNSLLECAVTACNITYFYNIAEKMKHPPWCVTANLCIVGRSAQRIWFNEKVFPKTGGGEDVDFCIRWKNLIQPFEKRNESIVAVPEAVVHHPLWTHPFKQICGWANGDSRCLEQLPACTFYSLPNWVESLFLLLISICIQIAVGVSTWSENSICQSLSIASVLVLGTEVFFSHLMHFRNIPNSIKSYPKKLVISLLAALPSMIQDCVRLLSKMRRCQWYQLCLNFDWMDGQQDHVAATRFGQLIKWCVYVLLWHALMLAELTSWSQLFSLTVVVLLIVFWYQSQFVDQSASMEVDRMVSLTLDKPPAFHFTRSLFSSPKAVNCTRFVVLSYQRSGSNLLCGKLHNHSEVLMHNEVFNEAVIYSYADKYLATDEKWQWTVHRRDHHPELFLETLFTFIPHGLPKSRITAIGLKLFPEHFRRSNHRYLEELLVDPRVKKILLRRENYLAAYVSKLRADKTGCYLKENLDHVKVRINCEAFQKFIDNYVQCFEYYERLVRGQSVFRISYEELTQTAAASHSAFPSSPSAHHATPSKLSHGHDLSAFQRLLRFLEVDHSKDPPALAVTVKQTTKPLFDAIQNIEEVKAAFECSHGLNFGLDSCEQHED